MKKINLLVLSLTLVFLTSCSKNLKTSAMGDGQVNGITLNIQKNLTVNKFDGRLVNWPPLGLTSVQIPSGKHALSCSYHVTESTDFVTTQQSANNILLEQVFEKGKTYSLTYKINGDNVTLQLEEAPATEKTEATSATQEPAQDSESK